MTYSQYAYVEAFINEKQQAWITAHIHMYEYFGGVAKILVPDNCKTAVVHNGGWYNQQVNTTYHEMAEHYGTAIIPARVRAPKDKPNAEGTVGNISTWITAALRNEQFFSLTELNQAIKEKLKVFNARTFQKKEGSRLSSVPFEYIKRKVDVRVTDKVIEIFYNHNRIASHPRLHGRKGQYQTIVEHMPEYHLKYLEWNGDRFRQWAERIGINTYKVVDAILTSKSVEQQTYRSCMGLLKLADRYSVEALEQSCAKALTYTATPSYKNIKNILTTGSYKSESKTVQTEKTTNKYGITRGAGYYGGK